MNKKIILLSLVLVVLTAGCLGLGGSNNDSPTNNNSSEKSADSPTNNNNSTSISEDFGPETISGEDVEDKLVGNDLKRYESYTFDFAFKFTDNSSEPYTIRSLYKQYNKTSDRGYRNLISSLNSSQYTENDVTYTRLEYPDTDTGEFRYDYDKYTEPYNATSIPVNSGFESNTDRLLSTLFVTGKPSQYSSNITLEKQGYRTYEDRNVAVYSSESKGNYSEVPYSTVTFNKRNLTAYMTEDQRTLRGEIKFTGVDENNETVSVTTYYKFQDINSTTVTKPDWLSEFED